MKSAIVLFVLAFIILLIPTSAVAQCTLTGSVSDSLTHDRLVGVNVTLVGTSLGAATTIEGDFRITGISARPYQVKFSCIGYETKLIDVDFSTQKDLVLDVRLKQIILEGEEVVVTGQLKGQVAAINQQITSKTIVNVVSEEKIKELPDANAAEAIGRLPGVSVIRSGGEATGIVLRGLSSKFSNITIDGVKIPPTDANTRDVDLSMLSQGSLAGIELHKTLTPDQDADAIAGSVNLVTRKAPSERQIEVDTKGNYNYLMKSGKQYDVLARYGERFLDDVVGIQLQVNSEQKIRSRENTAYGYYAPNNPTQPGWGDYWINEFTVLFTDETRKRNGGQAIIDLNTPDDGSVKLEGMYSETARDIMTFERHYPAGQGGFDYNYELSDLKTSSLNGSIHGTNHFFGFEVDWSGAFAQSRTQNPFGYRMSFTEPSGGTYQISKDHPEINIIPFANNNFARAVLDSSQYKRLENFDKEQTYFLNISQNLPLGDFVSNTLKAGGKYKAKARWRNNSVFGWNNYRQFSGFSNPDGTPIDFSGTRFAGASSGPELSRFLDPSVPTRDLLGLYRLSPLVNTDAFKEWTDLTKNGVFSQSPPDYGFNGVTALGNYFVTERVSSAYVMNTSEFGQDLTLIFGVRVERESNDYNAKFSDGSLGGTGSMVLLAGKVIDTTSTYTETVWLPSAQVSYRPTDFLTLRLAAYRALARPDFNLRLPQFSFQDVAANTNLVAGNPDLKDAKAWNFEVNGQLHDNTLGLVSLSAFYKKIDDLFHQANSVNVGWPSGGPNQLMGLNGWTTNAKSGAYYRLDNLLDQIGMSNWKKNQYFLKYLHYTSFSFNLSLAYNSPSPSYAWGIEFEHQMNFGFLPVSWMQHLVLSYNFSITRSRTDVLFNRTTTDSLYSPGLPPRIPPSYNLQSNNVPIFVTRDSEDQPEFYGNVALGYDLGGFSARISVFYQDSYTRQYSANGTADVIVDPFTKWDIVLKQQMTPFLALYANINNVFDRKETTSRLNNLFDWGNIPRTAEWYGRSVDFGARFTL